MKVTTTSINKPPKILIYGREGLGKSTFASGAPKPIFIATEDRINHLSVDAPEYAPGRHYATTYEEVISSLKWLLTNEHSYKSIVLDTLDSLQTLLYANVCKSFGTKDMQDMKVFPYQRGYEIAGKRWSEEITPLLEALNTQKKMWIVELSHVEVEKENPPDKEEYSKFTIPLHRKHIRPQVINACDIIGFIDERVIVSEEGKAKGTGELILKFKRAPFYNSKDSYGLPDSLPFRKDDSWKVFSEALMPLLKKGQNEGAKSKDAIGEGKRGDNTITVSGGGDGIGADSPPMEPREIKGNLGGAKDSHERAKAENKTV